MFAFGLLIAIAACGVCGGIVVNRRLSTWSRHYRLLAAFLPGLAALLIVSCVGQVLGTPAFNWNQARLTPLFSVRYGYSLYNLPESGPVIDAIYGPISYLAYIPVLLAHSPTAAVLAGSVVATLYYLLPVVWIFLSGEYRHRAGRVVGLFLLVLFGLWTIGDTSLHYSCFNIHADAPALGFGAAACALLMGIHSSRHSGLALLFSAMCTVLAMFTKQSLVFLVPVLMVFLWIADGKRRALQFAVMTALLSVVMLALCSAVFSTKALYFNLYEFPSHDRFGNGYMNLPRGGAAFAVTVLVRVGQKLWEHCRWLVLAAAICYVVEGHVLGRKRSTAREWLRSNRWAVFQFVALGGLPLSLLFAAKEGGDANSYSLHVYFSLIGVLLFLGHLMLKHESISRPVAAVCILLAAMVVPAAVTALDIPTLIRNLKTSDTEQVYQYDKKHPGEIYFSFFTLPVLMAEGHLYHFEYGLFHRELGQARVSQAHFLQYVPLNARDVQREPDNSPIREYLPQFSCETQQLGFPDLHFYATCLVPAPPK